jgi:hypothetical protein
MSPCLHKYGEKMKSSVFRAESIKGNSSWSLGLFAGVLAIALDVSGQFSLADEPREPFFSANELHLRRSHLS